jgi:tetratricopeptide (TPR) repeat protein
MKKIFLSFALMSIMTCFSQQDEFKTLQKIYDKEVPSPRDVLKYKETLTTYESIAKEESDKVYVNFYKSMLPMLELTSLGQKVSPTDFEKILTPQNLALFTKAANETVAFEKKSGNLIFTNDINESIATLKPMLANIATQYYNAKKFIESQDVFYALYKLDPSDGVSLENAANISLDTKDYVKAEKLFEEYLNSDYMKNGVSYFAINKATEKEEKMIDLKSRKKLLDLGTHEKPRDVKNSDTKAEIFKTYALVVNQNKDVEKTKSILIEARKMLPSDEDLLNTEFAIYINEGYKMLEEDNRIVTSINANLEPKNKVTYESLLKERKEMFTKALPVLEKAYAIKPTDENAKSLIKITYEVLEMKEKADKIK